MSLTGGSVVGASAPGKGTSSALLLVADRSDEGDIGLAIGGSPVDTSGDDGDEVAGGDDFVFVHGQLGGFVDTLDGVLAVAAIELTDEALLVAG
jgi:hypothetical protein